MDLTSEYCAKCGAKQEVIYSEKIDENAESIEEHEAQEDNKLKYCQSCGQEITSDSKFCQGCGTKLL